MFKHFQKSSTPPQLDRVRRFQSISRSTDNLSDWSMRRSRDRVGRRKSQVRELFGQDQNVR